MRSLLMDVLANIFRLRDIFQFILTIFTTYQVIIYAKSPKIDPFNSQFKYLYDK